jgi:hypothetical protein
MKCSRGNPIQVRYCVYRLVDQPQSLQSEVWRTVDPEPRPAENLRVGSPFKSDARMCHAQSARKEPVRGVTNTSRILGIKVGDDLVARWSSWFAPDPQPFLVDRSSSLAALGDPLLGTLDPQLRDTYEVYALGVDTRWRVISNSEFSALSRDTRAALVRGQRSLGRSLVPSVRSWPSLKGRGIRSQADGHRFVWWPSLFNGNEEAVLSAYVEFGRHPSRHADVTAAVWRHAAFVLPGALEIAGTFPRRSGPNCFGTVMAAAGVTGAAEVWMQQDAFESWLAESTRPGGNDKEPGTVLVWHSPKGLAQHAAITLGGGWALHKPSQGWMSPTKVLTVTDVMRSARTRGRRLTRRSLK